MIQRAEHYGFIPRWRGLRLVAAEEGIVNRTEGNRAAKNPAPGAIDGAGNPGMHLADVREAWNIKAVAVLVVIKRVRNVGGVGVGRQLERRAARPAPIPALDKS